MKISLIVAVSKNNVIGRDGQLPWRLSADLKRFKQLTMGHAMIMGRKTWDSLGRPLPGRESIVLTRQRDWRSEGAHAVASLEHAVELIGELPVIQDQAFVIGGAEVYRLALPMADRLYITRVDADVEGDTVFPAIDTQQWHCGERHNHQPDDRNEYAYAFEVWQRLRN